VVGSTLLILTALAHQSIRKQAPAVHPAEHPTDTPAESRGP